jgi:hypothetical protein
MIAEVPKTFGTSLRSFGNLIPKPLSVTVLFGKKIIMISSLLSQLNETVTCAAAYCRIA